MTAVRYANVNYWGRNKRLPVRPKAEDVRYTFSTGQCHSLALALHAMTGWPLFVLCDQCECEDCCDGGSCGYEPDPAEDGAHVVVQRPDGRFVDIGGAWWPSNPSHWSWANLVPVPVTEDQVLELDWDQIDAVAAMPFAEAVLKAMKVTVPRVPLAVAS